MDWIWLCFVAAAVAVEQPCSNFDWNFSGVGLKEIQVPGWDWRVSNSFVVVVLK